MLKQINTAIVNVYDSTNTLVVPQRTSIQFKGPFTIADDAVNQHTVITNTAITSSGAVTSLTGGGHVTVSASTGAVTLGSDANSIATASTLPLYDASGFLFANAFKFPVADATPTITQGQATGAGAPLLIQSQQGAVGFVGGQIKIVAGDGGTPGTNAASGVLIDVGTAVGGISQKLSVQSGAVEFCSIKKDTSGVGTTILASTLAQTRLQVGALVLNDGTAGTTGDTATFGLSHAGASTLTWAAGITSLVDSISQNTSGAGVSRTISGQQGKAGSVGGDVFLKSGAGGTPGTQAAGVIHLDDGQTVAGSSAGISLESGGSSYGQIQKVGAYTQFSATGSQNAELLAPAGTVLISASADVVSTGTNVRSSSNTWYAADNGTGFPFIEYNRLAASSHVLSFCRNAVITTTNMPANSGDGVINLANCIAAPSVVPDNTGIVIYSQNGQLKTWDLNKCRTQISTLNQSTITAYTNILRGSGELTFAAASTSGAIATLKATDVDNIAKKPSGVVKWTITGYDATKTANYTAYLVGCIRSTTGTAWSVQGSPQVVTSQNDTTNTYTPNLTVSGNDLIFTVTSNSTDSINWHVIYTAELGAGTA